MKRFYFVKVTLQATEKYKERAGETTTYYSGKDGKGITLENIDLYNVNEYGYTSESDANKNLYMNRNIDLKFWKITDAKIVAIDASTTTNNIQILD